MNDWIPAEGGESIDSLPAPEFQNYKPKYKSNLNEDSSEDYSNRTSYPSTGKGKPFKSKYPQNRKTKVYKKVERRDYEANPLTEEEFNKQVSRGDYTAVWHLSRRDQSVKQIRDKLKRKDLHPEVIEKVIDKLIENGELDDARFATNFTHSKTEYRKLGRNAIKMEMLSKGISQEIVNTALEEINPEDERARGVLLVRNEAKKTSLKKLEKHKQTQRLLGMLTRKGYSFSMSADIIKEVLNEEIIDDSEI